MDSMKKRLLETNSSLNEFNSIVSEFFKFNNIENVPESSSAMSDVDKHNLKSEKSKGPAAFVLGQKPEQSNFFKDSEAEFYSGYKCNMFENM